jgi:hypothetical protein
LHRRSTAHVGNKQQPGARLAMWDRLEFHLSQAEGSGGEGKIAIGRWNWKWNWRWNWRWNLESGCEAGVVCSGGEVKCAGGEAEAKANA